jgi:phenylpropionate dioxygenase-like ring-hydroxylating dioxygenase large terminal subunit
MFLKDAWQVAAFAKDVGRHLLARTLANEDVILYRTLEGDPVALYNTCPHRLVPLSLGKLVDNNVQCAYHGLCFDPSGDCVKVPGQERIPASAKVRKFPVVERYDFIWIWLGDPALADDGLVPNFHWMTDPDWAISDGYHHIAAHYQLLNDNLLDLSHETFVHSDTIGNAAVADSPLSVEVQDNRVVRAHRDMLNCEPPPFYIKATGFSTRIDRWHTTIYTPPAFLVIENGAMPAGSDKEDARAKGMTRERRILNLITPETETSSHYFWAVARSYDLSNLELTEYIRKEIVKTFNEDKVLLEAQQQKLGAKKFTQFPVTLRADAGAVQGRRVLNTLVGAND